MKRILTLKKMKDLNAAIALAPDELLIDTTLLSRTGEITLRELSQIINQNWGQTKLILNWDILMTDKLMNTVILEVEKIQWEMFSAIRVQDLGALEWLYQKRPECPIHLNLETGHHNRVAIKSHLDLFPSIKRVVLSQELESSTLQEYLKELEVESEVLVLGSTLLFYTPRHLVTPLYELAADESIQVLATSEESPHKGFPILENRHGTFMFNIKDHCLLDHMAELESWGMTAIRIDLPLDENFELIKMALDLCQNFNGERFEIFKAKYPRQLSKAFYRSNKSDVLFKKLKNAHLASVDQGVLGAVVEQRKEHYTALKLKSEIKKADLPLKAKLLTTDGKWIEVSVKSLRNARGEDVDFLQKDEIALLNPLRKASVKALLCKEE
ncbi:MAG: hypothetical protein CO099_02815 [Bdellovibrio sp. CG_4_9_14_3_um_filter_39_7]|nr:MAG: hypothetical protein CO099_02815 [Bdellovibrio sp. CG_4_9_14_3_um_filter_39_7]